MRRGRARCNLVTRTRGGMVIFRGHRKGTSMPKSRQACCECVLTLGQSQQAQRSVDVLTSLLAQPVLGEVSLHLDPARLVKQLGVLRRTPFKPIPLLLVIVVRTVQRVDRGLNRLNR